ncbi:MAG: dihydroneopterin triphosphate diphosphatase [Gallionella sp.]
MKRYKQPVSVLVVIYAADHSVEPEKSSQFNTDLKVLLLERADHPGYWQSVTGSREQDETLAETAVREVREETGLDATRYPLSDWQIQNVYEIYPHWRFRYPPDITHNTEHVFSLELPRIVPIQLASREHLNFQWLPWQDAAEAVFSPSNRAAILQLPEHVCCCAEKDK